MVNISLLHMTGNRKLKWEIQKKSKYQSDAGNPVRFHESSRRTKPVWWIFEKCANDTTRNENTSLTWTQKLSDQLNLAHVARKNMCGFRVKDVMDGEGDNS